MSPVVAVTGVIPGAGATTTVAALGSALAEQRNHVALVDASPEGSRLAEVLSLPDGDRLADALRRSADLANVQVDGPHGTVCFPAAPETAWHSIRPGAVASLYEDLRARFDLALVDCGSAVTPATAAWLGHADELVVVADADVADAVADRVAVGEAFDTPLRGVVANRVVRDEAPAALNRLETTGQPVLAALPEDPTVGAAAGDRRSILEEDPDSVVATCTWKLAKRFASRDHDEPVVPTGWIDEGDDGSGRTETGDVDTSTADDSGTAADGSAAAADGGTPDGAATGARDASAAASTASDSAPNPGATSDASHGSSTDRQSGAGSSGSDPEGTADAFEFERDGLESATGDDRTDATSGSEGDETASESGSGATASESVVDEAAPDADVADPSTGTDDGDRATESDATSPTDRFDDALGDSSQETGDRVTTDRDDASSGVADSATGRTDETGESGDGPGDGSGGEISDEEIQEVFKETLERVEESDAEGVSDGAGDGGTDGDGRADGDGGADDDGDSLLSGFTDG